MLYKPGKTEMDASHKAKFIPLEDVLKVAASKSLIKGKHAFQIVTAKKVHWFGTDSSEDTDSWVETLNEELFGLPKPGVFCKLLTFYTTTSSSIRLVVALRVPWNSYLGSVIITC